MRPETSLDLEQLPLAGIASVTFYKRDELTSDLICCEVVTQFPTDETFFFHEEMADWKPLLDHLGQLPRFRTDWYVEVVQPPFALNRTVAYRAKG